MGQRWVNVGSTFGQPWVNVGSTFGNLRTYLGPIFADFARVSGETEGLHGVLIRNDQFSNRETAFSGFVLDQSPLRAPWEKKKRIPNVSTRFAILCTAPSSKSQQKFDQLFQISAEISAKIAIFQQCSWNFPPILMKIYRHFAKYFRKLSTSFKFHNF